MKRRRANPAFSILELLVAMVVLAIVLVMVTQIVNQVLASTRTQNAQMDSVAAARTALDRLESDLEAAVSGRTVSIMVPASPTQPIQIAFAAVRRGPDTITSPHRFLGVCYATNANNELIRTYRSLAVSESDLLGGLASLSGSSTNQSVIGEGILAWQIRALRSKESTPIGELLGVGAATTIFHGLAGPAGWAALVRHSDPSLPNVEAVKTLEVWTAAVGLENLRLITSTGSSASIASALSGEPESWRQAIDDSPSIPGPVKSAIRVLKKVIPLP